jgi:hypothetical protein
MLAAALWLGRWYTVGIHGVRFSGWLWAVIGFATTFTLPGGRFPENPSARA